MSKYNGWTNWETWNANLWIDNDWRMSESFALQAGDLLGSYESDEATVLLSERISDFFIDMMPSNLSGFYDDAVSMAFRSINFKEIAKHYIQEFQTESEA